MYGINERLINLVRNDYSEHLSEKPFKLDCSLGENPFGSYDGLDVSKEELLDFSSYPHSEDLVVNEVVKKFSSIANIDTSMIAVSCGSMGVLMGINRMLLNEGKKIIGIAPQFSAIIDDFNTYGAEYIPVYMRKENNYRFDLKDFLCCVDNNPNAYIYIDNPNNPTGQTIDLEQIEKIVKAAKNVNSLVCIDEAYGDYMEVKSSAVSMLNSYDNLVVVRSVSKGLGAAGIRIGVLIASKGIVDVFKKVNIPFSTTSIGNIIGSRIINSDWEEKVKIIASEVKNKLRLSLKNIKMSCTNFNVPICMYYVDDESIDLEALFIDAGMRVVSCSGYYGTSINAVRINLNKDYEEMIRIMLEVDKKVGSEL